MLSAFYRLSISQSKREKKTVDDVIVCSFVLDLTERETTAIDDGDDVCDVPEKEGVVLSTGAKFLAEQK